MTVTLKWACYYDTTYSSNRLCESTSGPWKSCRKSWRIVWQQDTHTNLWYWPTVLFMNFLYSNGHISLIPRPGNEGEGEYIDSSLQNMESLWKFRTTAHRWKKRTPWTYFTHKIRTSGLSRRASEVSEHYSGAQVQQHTVYCIASFPVELHTAFVSAHITKF